MDVLNDAALNGDVYTLRKVYNENLKDLRMYFLGLKKNETFIDRAVKKNHYRFLSEALTILPSNIVLKLLTRTDKIDESNPLHHAAKEGNIFTVKLLVKAYLTSAAALGYQGTPPWLTKNKHGDTPLHNCFLDKATKAHGHVACYLVSQDHDMLRTLGEQMHPCSPEQSATMVLDKTGASILFLAMQKGFVELAEQIIASDLPYNLSGTNGENPLHYAAKCNICPSYGDVENVKAEQVTRRLLKKHPELVGKEPGLGSTVLDKAVVDNARWLVKLMLNQDDEGTRRPWNKACRRLIWHINPTSYGDTPLHIAARKGFIGIAKLLVRGYECAVREEAKKECDVPEAHLANDNLGVSPLHIENSLKEIPLIVALKERHDDFAVYMLSSIHVSLKLEYPYEIAVKNRCTQSIRMIIKITKSLISEYLSVFMSNDSTIHPSVLKIVQHFALSSKITGDVARLVLEAFPRFQKAPQKEAKEHLKKAAENNEAWLVELLLEGDSSLIHDSPPAWRIACKKGHLSTLLAFLAPSHQQEFIRHCRDIKDTPLHHIMLSNCEDYKNLMANPTAQELNNQVDSVGATPLHRALEHKNINLINSLLETKGIKLDIEDQKQTTVLDLLEEKIKTSGTLFRLYKKLLVMSIMTDDLKNRVNKNGVTFLHRAIEGNDYSLTKVLIETKGVKLDIEDLVILEAKSVADGNFLKLYKDLLENSLMTNELKNRVDKNGDTSLHIAIGKNAYRLVKALVHTKGVSLEIKDGRGKTALDMIEERCSNRSNDTYWYELYTQLLTNTGRLHKMMNRKGSTGDTPLHIAIEWDDLVLAKVLVQTKGIQVNVMDDKGKMALDLIEEKCYQLDSPWYDFYEELITSKLISNEMKNKVDGNGATSLHRAISKNARKAVGTLIGIKGINFVMKDNNNVTALDLIEERCKTKSEDRFWFDKYCELLRNSDMLQTLKNHKGKSEVTPLHIAIEWDDPKLAKTLVHTKGTELNIVDFNQKTALDLITERSYQNEGEWYELYKELLYNPTYVRELKNRQGGVNNETPLHRAIKLGDFRLAKTLLETERVRLDIKDKDGKTVLDLLGDRYDLFEKWGDLCREIRLDPRLKIFKFKFLQRRTSLKDMNNTLSVVAALLATITFAAGFTIPGGLDSKDGTALLGIQVAFLAFSIANTIAMCSSMVVLFSLTGAMIWEAHPKSTVLIDFCVFMLQISLCGTIVAFTSGVYAIMAPKVLWAAILVIILCSLAFLVAFCVLLYFWPLLYMVYIWLKTCVSCGKRQFETDQASQSRGSDVKIDMNK